MSSPSNQFPIEREYLAFRIWLNHLPIETDLEITIYDKVKALLQEAENKGREEAKQELRDKFGIDANISYKVFAGPKAIVLEVTKGTHEL